MSHQLVIDRLAVQQDLPQLHRAAAELHAELLEVHFILEQLAKVSLENELEETLERPVGGEHDGL